MSNAELPHERIRRQRIEGARRYAQAERTDPFAFNRAMMHIDNGLAGGSSQQHSGHNHYDAEHYYEHREYTRNDGEVVKYQVPAYRNVTRP